MSEPIYVFWPVNLSENVGELYGWILDNAVVVGRLGQDVGHQLKRVGEICPDLDGVTSTNLSGRARKCSHEAWISLDEQLNGVASCKNCKMTLPNQVHVIKFTVPNTSRRQFYSLKSLTLNLHDYRISHHASPSLQPYDTMKLPELDIEKVIDTLNLVHSVQETPRRLPKMQWLVTIVSPILILFRYLAEPILLALNYRFSFLFGSSPKHLSWTLQQFDLRLSQFCFWPWQIEQFRNPHNSMEQRNLQYLSFFNVLWLIANDVIIGWAVGSWIIEQREPVATFAIDLVQKYGIEGMRKLTIWLMGWPGGLKLNDQLDTFLGELFLWLLDTWQTGLMYMVERGILSKALYVGGYLAMVGCSFLVAWLSDIASFLFSHIYLFYTVSARLYHWNLTVLQSLFYLFRGRKYNVLIHQVDTNDYTLDQLMLGTILFTILIFLFPTVFVYFALFAVARSVLVFGQLVAILVITLLNHFPLFSLMLRVKEPRRLPSGIGFKIKDGDLYLESLTVGFGSIFKEYGRLFQTITSDLFSTSVLKNAIKGQPVRRLGRGTNTIVTPRPPPENFVEQLLRAFQ